IVGDEVPGRGGAAADGVARGAADGDTGLGESGKRTRGVAHGRRSVRAHADVIAGDDRARRPGTANEYAVERVAGNDVALRRVIGAVAIGADTIAGRKAGGRGGDNDAEGAIGHGRGAGLVGAEVVAGHDIVVRAAAG